MKKIITITVCAAILVISCKQLKEMQAVQQAIKGKKYQQAASHLDKLKSVLDTLQEKDQKKYYPMYYHYRVLALYAGGKNLKSNYEVGRAFKDLEKYEKEINVQKYTKTTRYVLDTMLIRIQKKAMQTYKNQNFAESSNAFHQFYELNPKDTSYLSNAALTALQAKKYDTSIAYYEKLLALGFTGITKQYKAVNKEGKEIFFATKKDMMIQVAMKEVKDSVTTVTESKVGEMTKNLALAYIAKGEKKSALQAIQNAKKMFPNDYTLIISEANIYYELGDNEKFLAGLNKAIALQPENPVLHYNIGVMTMNQTTDNDEKLRGFNKKYEADLKKLKKNKRKNRKKIKQLEKTHQAKKKEIENLNNYFLKKAEDSFRKAIDLKKDYKDAYVNLSVIILKKSNPIVEEMNNNLSNFKKYDALMVKKKAVEKEALPYIEKAHELAPEDEGIIKNLINLYESLQMEQKRKVMMKKRKSLNK